MNSVSHTLAIAAAIFLASTAGADEGHDHDHGQAAPAAAGQALPRFAAVSETFELVGVLSGQQITLYLDRFGDNSPVRGAQIELEIAGKKFMAQKLGDDGYEVVLPQAPEEGLLPVTAVVTAGDEVDLLAGELDIHEEGHADEAAHPQSHPHSWTEHTGWAVGGAAGGAALLALLLAVGRRFATARNQRAGGAA